MAQVDQMMIQGGGDMLSRPVIDSDVHPYLPGGVVDLQDYMGEEWHGHLRAGRPEAGGKASFAPPSTHYVNLGGSTRLDAAPPSGAAACSDPAFSAADLLDRHNLGAAVLMGGDVLGLGGLANADLAAALAAGYNSWLADNWLNRDPRWKGSVVVAPQDPVQAAEEISRWADHPSMVCVFVPNANVLLGKRQMYPIYEAAASCGFPITVHPGGVAAGVNSALLPVQAPSYFVEYLSCSATTFMAHLCSLIFEGVFERFPRLKVGIVEAGFAWLPHFLWRMDSNWKGLRRETPWVRRPPSDYVREHIRVTTQPMYEPEKRSHLLEMFDMIHAEEVLMFSTDYPHWDGDDPSVSMRRIPSSLRRRVFHDNPRDFYRGDICSHLVGEPTTGGG
jgi:predicted TIM-barrel fold metal-dependent hydrolase